MNQNIPPMPGMGNNQNKQMPKPPDPVSPSPPNNFNSEQSQNQRSQSRIEFSDQDIEDIFDDSEQHGEGQRYQQHGEGGRYEGDNGNYQQDDYDQPQMQVNSNVLSVVGIIGMLVVVFFVFKVSKTKYNNYRDRREYNIKMNSVDTFRYEDNTDAYDYSEENGTSGEMVLGEVVTEVAKYKRSVSEDNRTILKLEIDNYGDFDIFISKYQYDTLEDKGYIIVDMEMINKKVNYVFISNKQENFKDILNGK